MSARASCNRAESSYFAQPYNISAEGFSFTDLDGYQAKALNRKDAYGLPVEEFEIQYIDGDHAELFTACRVSQADLADWFDLLDGLGDDGDRYVIACHLAGLGYAIGEIPDHWDDYSVHHCTAADYAAEIVAECYQIPGNLEAYIDYGRLGRDMVLEGSITEIEYDLILVGG